MMTSQLRLKPLEKSERADYGLAQVRDAAFEAVLKVWRQRANEGWTQKRLADNIDRDKATVSKYFRGPSNWTMRTLGELVQGLKADIRIIIDPLETPIPNGSNFDAYDELDWDASQINTIKAQQSGTTSNPKPKFTVVQSNG